MEFFLEIVSGSDKGDAKTVPLAYGLARGHDETFGTVFIFMGDRYVTHQFTNRWTDDEGQALRLLNQIQVADIVQA